jgi:hypothetical protein
MTEAPPPGGKKVIGKVVTNLVTSAIDKATRPGPVGKITSTVAKKIATRSPLSAAVVGGVWVAHKLYKRKKERDEEARALAARPVKAVTPDKTGPKG